MPRFTLFLKADLENLTNLHTEDDMRWSMKLRFPSSNETTDKPVYVCAQDWVENGKDKVNFLIRDKLTKREGTIDVELKSRKPYTLDDSAHFVPVVTFECRNIEPVEFYPGKGWFGENPKSGMKFEVDLAEDFADYDDEAAEPVGLYNVESREESIRSSLPQSTMDETFTAKAQLTGSINIHTTAQCVVDSFLYISSARMAKNSDFLESQQISVIVNATTETKNHFPETIAYHNVEIMDMPDVDVRKILREVPVLIEDARTSSKRVLVHCAAGVSRSATIVLAYLITYRDMTLHDAYTHLKAVRPVIRPNNGFWRQLVELETDLTGVSTVNLIDVNGEKMPEMYYLKGKSAVGLCESASTDQTVTIIADEWSLS